ncbi:MAG: hypothetical protein HY941_09485 [Gammaproteobacteria bacterium]|nr:hypothetical protein [Gammaproteobacteria bacterium]
MNAKVRVALWVAFWLFSLLTLYVDLSTWLTESRSTVRLSLAVISLALGMSILTIKEHRRRSIVLVTLGVIVGQWWLVKWAAVYVLWSINGFAP